MEAKTKPPEQGRYDLVLADYPPWQGLPKRSLVICTQQRCGSTLLGEAIYFAGGLGCPLEYFHVGFRPGFEARWKPADFRDYVATLHRLRTDPSGTFAIKLFWRDLLRVAREINPAEFGAPFTSSDMLAELHDVSAEAHRRMFATMFEFLPLPVFVLLTRRDQIRQAVSLAIAAQTRRWRKFNSSRTGGPQAQYRFYHIVRLLAAIQKSNADWMDFLRANHVQYYEIVYEDLLHDYEATLRKFFTAIGRPDAPIVAPRLVKQADALSEEYVQRFLEDFRRRTDS